MIEKVEHRKRRCPSKRFGRPRRQASARRRCVVRRAIGRVAGSLSHSRLGSSLDWILTRHGTGALTSQAAPLRCALGGHDPGDGTERVQRGAAGEAAAVRDLRGAGDGATGALPPARRGRGVALRAASVGRVPAAAGRAGFRGLAHDGVARGGMLHPGALAGARRPPRAGPRGGTGGRAAASRLLLLAGAAGRGRGALGGRRRRRGGDRPPAGPRAGGARRAAVAAHDVPLVPRGPLALGRSGRRLAAARRTRSGGPGARCGTWGRPGGAPRAPACPRC
jgi:hypothetical protein